MVIIVLVRFWCSKWPTSIHITWLWCQDVSNCLLGEKGPTNSGKAQKNFFHRGRCFFTGCLLDMAGHLEAVGVVAVWETDCLCGFPEVFSLLYTSTSSHPPTCPAVRTLVAPFPPRPLGRISPALFLTSPTDWWPSPSSPTHSSLLSQKMSKYVQSFVHNIFSYKSKCFHFTSSVKIAILFPLGSRNPE